MSPLTFYIVYHKVFYESNLHQFSPDIRQCLVWVAVNESIPKDYPTNGRLLKEWEMDHYSPLYQMNHWYQNSFFHHLYLNRHLIQTKYVGFGQYDQRLDGEEFKRLHDLLESDKGDKLIGTFFYPIQACFDILTKEQWSRLFVDSYNFFYKVHHTMEELEPLPMILLHTFIIPTWYFNHMMPFIQYMTPRVLQFLEWDTRHLAGTLERVYAFTLAAGMLEGKFRDVILFRGIEQNDSQRTSDSFRGL